MGDLEKFSSNMGRNLAGGAIVEEVEVNAGKTSASSIVENNENLGSMISAMKKNDGTGEVDLETIVLVTPLETSTLDTLKKNVSTDEGRTLLETYKEELVENLSEEDKEGIKGTADLLNDFIGDVNTEGMNEETKKLIDSLKESVANIAKTDFDTENDETYNVTKGDVIALQYTVSLLTEVSTAIPEEGVKIEKNGKEVSVTSTDVINALFGNESANKESGFTMSDVSLLMDTPEGAAVAGDIIQSVESYLNVVSSVSNMTGGVDTSSLISSFLKKN